MRRIALLTLALLVAGHGHAQEAPMPTGCEGDATAAACQWTIDTRAAPGRTRWAFDLPPVDDGYVTVVILLEGTDGGWTSYVLDGDGRPLSSATHEGDRQPASPRHRASYALMLEGGKARTFVFSPVADTVEAQGATVNNNAPGGASSGVFRISWHIEGFSVGEVPSRPAATRDDPHLLAPAGDARQGASDIVAAWLDDARLDDGRFEARLAVGDARDWAWRDGGEYLRYHYEFELQDRRYRATWGLAASNSRATVDEVSVSCGFGALNSAGFAEELVAPACDADWDDSTFSMSIPTAVLGEPSGAAQFTRMSAVSYSGAYHGPTGLYSTSLDTLDDEARGERYPFALGGPDVWDVLNPRLKVPAEVVPLWYQAPLREENIPDTLQVLGATAAVATFIFGFIAIRRQRRLVARMIARVDAVVQGAERETRRALLLLGEIEIEYARMLREGELREGQYALLAQYIASAAARLATRERLGLDDGVPGGPGQDAGVSQ